jgi:hypothetical protein
MFKRLTVNAQGRPDGLWVIMCVLGLIALAAGTLVSAERLAGITTDGALSFSLQERLRCARAVLLLIGTIFATIGCWRSQGRPAGILVLFGALAWMLTVITHLYPNHLLARPDKVLQAALGEELLLSDYAPRPHLAVPRSDVNRAKFPVINAHAHFRRSARRTPEEMVAIMDACNIQTAFDMDGGMGGELDEEISRFPQAHEGRFLILASFWFGQQISDWDYFGKQVQALEQAKAQGGRGIKIWKNLGLWTRDENRRLIAIDDPRVDPLWAKAGELHLPILIHLADLQANFDPLDRFNERYEFLKKDIDLAYQGPKAPSPLTLLSQFEQVVSRHPETTFILAHVGNRTDDLRRAGELLDRHPNLFMDISARANELGRQPSSARAFFLKYSDRLLFGTDGNPDEKIYRGYFRVLETDDDFFDDPRWPRPEAGRWKLYGLRLPDAVLRNVYHDNAAQLFGLPLLPEEHAEP